MARSALGDDYPLWRRAGQLAEHNDVEFTWVWRALQELRNAGHALRDRRVLELARRLRDDAKAYSEHAAKIHERRRTDGDATDS